MNRNVHIPYTVEKATQHTRTHTRAHLTSLHVRHSLCGAQGPNTPIPCCSSAFHRNAKSNKFPIVSTGGCIVVVDVEMESHRDINKLHHHSNADDYRAFDPDFRVEFFSYFLRALSLLAISCGITK